VQWKSRYIALLLALAAAFAAGYGVRALTDDRALVRGEIRLEGFQLINPLLECDTGRASLGATELRPFEERLQKAVKAHLAKRTVRSVAVYFRDLRNGPWVGVNEDEKFTPSSLMKVPLMMTILKRAEREPSILKKRLRYDGEEDLTARQSIKPPEGLRKGESYTVDELIFRMIAYSDNNATRLLAGKDGEARVADLMAELGIPYDRNAAEDYISVRNYTSFFRVLFNASYLNHEMSELALKYLSQSSFSDGIEAGLPTGTALASKFGEFSRNTRGGEGYQLQEMGIVYYPEHPYLLGISVKGADFSDLPGILGDLSRTIYGEVDRQYRQHPVQGDLGMP
jgi:beta-lactamase class A